MSNSALYLYAVVPHPFPRDVLGPIGIDGRVVEEVAAPDVGLSALAHVGAPIPFQGADDDVKRWILEHSRVVERAWEAAGAVLPVTFNVIVKGDDADAAHDRTVAWMRASAKLLRERLEALRGRAELWVEISLDRAVAARDESDVKELRGAMQDKPPGLRRLLDRKLEQVEKEAVERMADRLYPELRRRLASRADGLEENRKMRPAPGLVPVLAAAVLVAREAVEGMGTELARIQAEQPAARIRFLGPWPPYSFVELSVPDADGIKSSRTPGEATDL